MVYLQDINSILWCTTIRLDAMSPKDAPEQSDEITGQSALPSESRRQLSMGLPNACLVLTLSSVSDKKDYST